MPTILLSKSDEHYMYKCALDQDFAFGLIIGQQAEPGKYIIVHLAKNCEEDSEDVYAEHREEGASPRTHGFHKIEDIDTQALSHQWLSAIKMIPGSFGVLGVFVTDATRDFADEQTFTSAKKLLYDVHNLLLQGNAYFGPAHYEQNDATTYLFLAYSAQTKKAVGKTYTHSVSGGSLSPADCRFVEKPFEWYAFECNYELDDVFPILDPIKKINIEHQFQHAIIEVKKSLTASEFFIQNENVDDLLTLEEYVKKRNARDRVTVTVPSARGNSEVFKVAIFLPVKCQISPNQPIKVKQFNGTIRFQGVISSRIWCNPRATLGSVKLFVREDILRSLAARIQVYCDGLTEPNVSQDAIFISEPPRRVYFNVPLGEDGGDLSPVQFSEYIFRGEAPTVAVAQAKIVLDMDINTENIVADLEGLPDDVTYSATSSTQSLEVDAGATKSKAERDLTRTMYMLGIAVSLLVLLLSILLHVFFN